MGKSRKITKVFSSFSEEEKTKLIKMAWEDRVTFKEIQERFGLTPNETEKFMLSNLAQKDFIRWKKRLQKRFTLKSKKAHLRRDLSSTND